MKRQYREFLKEIREDNVLAPLGDIFEAIFDEDLEDMNEETSSLMMNTLKDVLETQKNMIINEIIQGLERTGSNREQALNNKQKFIIEINKLPQKIMDEPYHTFIQEICNLIIDFTNQAIDQYHNYNFVLPIKLEEGAQMPTYAHSSDAAADLYAKEDITLPAHSISNFINTGVRIALPENWMAIVVPRSSMGTKTGLRLSNSQGIIDSKTFSYAQ